MRSCSWGYLLAVMAFVGLMFPASPGCADLYKWVDENGTVWFTDDPSKLPKESHGEFEKEKAEKKPSGSPAQSQPPRSAATKTTTSRSAGTYLQKQNQRLQEKKALEQEVSTLEEQLTIAREALQKVWLSDRVGYWFVVDPETGKKVRASYKDPGAVWSYDTWPEVPREARTRGSEERKRIQSDIGKMERELSLKKEELSKLSRSL